MALDEYKRRMEEIQSKLKSQTDKANDYSNRAAGFGEELQQGLRDNTEAFRVEQNDVNSKREGFYNSLGGLDQQLSKDYGADPSLYFQNLARERSRMGTNLSNSEDILNNKRGTITDFMNKLINASQIAAQKEAQGIQGIQQEYGFAQEGYNRALQEQQMAEARRQFNASQAGKPPVKTEAQLKLEEQNAMGEDLEMKGYLAKYQQDPQKQSEIGIAYKTGGMDSVRKLMAWWNGGQAQADAAQLAKKKTTTPTQSNGMNFDPIKKFFGGYTDSLKDQFKGGWHGR